MKKSALKLAIATAMFASAGAMAASDGVLGPTSTGTVLVQVSKGSVVQITGLADLALGNWTDASLFAAGGATASDTACVYSSVGNYHVTMTSLNGSAYIPAVAPNGGALAVAAVAPGGEAFTSPGDPVAQFADDINADGVCDTLAGDLNCVPDLDGAPASGFIAPNPGSAAVNAVYQMAGAGGTVLYDAVFNGNSSTGDAMGPYVGSNNVTCNGIDNATVSASINATALSLVTDGSYSDTLTLLVTPN